MIERLLIVVAFIFAVVAAYGLWHVAQRRRLTALAREASAGAGAEAGMPTILYFTTPDCVQCRLRQSPILEQLLSEKENTS
jgi:thioredoxin 1